MDTFKRVSSVFKTERQNSAMNSNVLAHELILAGTVKVAAHGETGASWYSYMIRNRRSSLVSTTARGVSPVTAEYWSKPLQTVYLSVEDQLLATTVLCSFRMVARDDASIAPSPDHTPFVCLLIRLTTGHSKSIPWRWSDQCRVAQPVLNRAGERVRQRLH